MARTLKESIEMVSRLTQAIQIDPRTLAANGSDVVIIARYLLPDGTEHSCEVRDLTIDGALFRAVPPAHGTALICYIDNLGRLEATVTHAMTDNFRVGFDLTGARRERMAERLRWLYGEVPLDEDSQARRAPRFQPTNRASRLTLPDGRSYECEIIDISVSGAAVKISVLPSIGTYVQLGKLRGRVVRHLGEGLALEFVAAAQMQVHQQFGKPAA